MRKLLEDAAQRAISYLEGLDSRGVAPSPDAVAKLAGLDEPLPEEPGEPETALKRLDEICSPATMGMSGPRFFGFVIGGSLPVTLAANWLAGAWDQNTAYYNATPATAQLEEISLRWILDLFHLPPECGGAFVTGATMANFSALAAARYAVLKRVGWNVEADGLFGAPPITVIVGAEAHPSLIKSLGLLGLGRSRTVRIPVDSQGRMRADALPPLSGPTIICAQAGNVNTGAFDPIAEICDRGHAAGAWIHVDGAFGLWALADPAMARLTAGMADADSWATDFHKWLNVPYDSGLALVRDAEALRTAMAVTAEYLPTASPYRNPSDFTPELSRRARGVEVWAALRTLGRKGVAELVARTCRHAARFAEGLHAAGYEVLNDVQLNQVLVAFGDAETTARVISEIQSEGTCWCGGTVWQGKTAMRISVSSWATTDEDVEQSLEAMLEERAEIAAARLARLPQQPAGNGCREKMKQSIIHVALVVRDYDEAIDFFCHKLHFTLVEDTYQPEQDKRWVVVAPPGSDGTNLLLARATTPEQVASIGNQTGGRVFLFLRTDDFWRDYNEMLSVGIKFVRPPKDAPYGTVAVFEDLYGNLWDLIGPNSDAAD